MLNIDISGHQDNFFVVPLTLDGSYFIFKFNYNAGFDFWSLAIFNGNTNELLFTTKIECLFDFLAYCTYLDIPGGAIIFDTTYPEATEYPKENDFINKIVTMKYIPKSTTSSMRR